MSELTIGFSTPRILDFDIEARPLGWYGGDFVHKETTAIASAWVVDGEAADIELVLLDRTKGSAERMYRAFLKRYAEADMVTGHYIRGFDLPVLNSGCFELDLGPLPEKLAHDTKGDLLRFQGLSKSQENLGSILGISAPKVSMSQGDWREANRLTPLGRELVSERVVGDVIQHVLMRAELLKRGFLGPPRLWTPGSGGATPSYTP